MNIDLSTLCLVGMGILLALYLVPRLLGLVDDGNPYSPIRSDRPIYDDPDLTTRGVMGRGRTFLEHLRGDVAPKYDDPNVKPHGEHGGSQ